MDDAATRVSALRAAVNWAGQSLRGEGAAEVVSAAHAFETHIREWGEEGLVHAIMRAGRTRTPAEIVREAEHFAAYLAGPKPVEEPPATAAEEPPAQA